MVKMRSRARIGSWLVAASLAASLCPATGVLAQTASPEATPEVLVRPPLVLGVAIDEAGMAQADLQRSQDLVLALLDKLPEGSQIMIGSFSGEKRIVLPPTADRALVTATLAGFEAGASGVALPDGLFDMVEYLGAQDFAARALLLFSAGRVREGDLQFEDPLNAATSKGVPIFALALGQGDGKLLRRIAKITGGEYVRLEVADAAMLAQSIAPREGSASSSAALSRSPEPPLPTPTPKTATGLLGAAAIFFSLGGLLMLGIVVLLIRRMSAPETPRAAAPGLPQPSLALSLSLPRKDAFSLSPAPPGGVADDDIALEKTLVVNANPTLRALSGPGAGKNFPLSASGHTTLGRSRRSDIVVPEDGASAQHCRIDREGDSYVVHDLGSTNGTWVNDARTERAVLQHGDRLKVGGTVFMVSLFGDRG